MAAVYNGRSHSQIIFVQLQVLQRLGGRLLRRVHPDGRMSPRGLQRRAKHLRLREPLARTSLRPAFVLVSEYQDATSRVLKNMAPNSPDPKEKRTDTA